MPNILLMHYFNGAGGKFIVNCLSMSGQVAFSNYQIALSYQQNKNIKNLEQALLDTIPSRDQSKTWFNLEQGCHQLFGKDITKIVSGCLSTDNLFNTDILKYEWLPIISHNKTSFDNIMQYFFKYKIFTVFLSATPNFIDCAVRLKWPEKHHCLDLDQFEEFNCESRLIEFDHYIPNWDPRDLGKHQEISNLARRLNIDYNSKTANDYICKYVEFHQ
jgi:hypothetical protein